jgi:exo-beta-1,3-glucanase (GH17 family)
MKHLTYILICIGCVLSHACVATNNSKNVTAATILGNSNYQAICYGGYRNCNREKVPTVDEIKDDLKILSAMNIKVLRTYNVHSKEIHHLLQAITELKKEQRKFEMYVMLGAWIDCKNAWTVDAPIHTEESENNVTEINEAVKLANAYSSIIKIISVGNEAMVHWATSYHVTPNIILKWVKHLQGLKQQNKLNRNVWITSSDNFASWGGGDTSYHTKDLNELIKAVDYISVHTYPMHDTHYNPIFWGIKKEEQNLTPQQKIDKVMLRVRDYAINQYNSVVNYMQSLGIKKPVHIGETGWATVCNELYGNNGTKATDEYKNAAYYALMRTWTNQQKISCFYFEAFDECWKNSSNPLHSENHFGLINLNNEAKYVIWKLVDQQKFKGLTRNGNPIVKTYQGNDSLLFKDVELPTQIIQQ